MILSNVMEKHLEHEYALQSFTGLLTLLNVSSIISYEHRKYFRKYNANAGSRRRIERLWTLGCQMLGVGQKFIIPEISQFMRHTPYQTFHIAFCSHFSFLDPELPQKCNTPVFPSDIKTFTWITVHLSPFCKSYKF